MKPKAGRHISEDARPELRDELTRNLRGQGDHSLLAWLRKGTRVERQYKLLGKMLLEDESRDMPVKPGSAPNDPKALRGIPAVGGFGAVGGAIAGTRPDRDALSGRRGEEILRGIRQRARERAEIERAHGEDARVEQAERSNQGSQVASSRQRGQARGDLMIGEKVQHFQDKGTDLGDLQSKIASYLQSERFTVQTSLASTNGNVIQAKKGGFLDEVIDADRALSILVSGDPNNFTVRIGIGKWLQHLGVAAVETLLLSDLFLVVDVGETAWNFEIEDKLAKQIESLVG